MAGQYSYPPPPPAPPAAPPNNFPAYNPAQAYNGRGGVGAMPTGRGRGHQAPGRGDYGAAYGGYPRHDYAHVNGAISYNPQQQQQVPPPPPPAAYWPAGAQMGHQPHGQPPLPQTSYPPQPSYGPQGYAPQPQPAFPPSAYGAPHQRPYTGPPYGSGPAEYPSAQQWGEAGSSYSSYPARGGRGGYQAQGDRGGHRTDAPMPPIIRMGFNQNSDSQVSNGFGHQYQSSGALPGAPAGPFPQPPYSGYPAPAPSYPAASHNSYTNNRGRGRDHFSNNSRGGGRFGKDERGEKSRRGGGQGHGHRQHEPSPQKSDNLSNKKKKRKTNTLGLTPGDNEDSEDGPVDEEKHLVELLGDMAVISDVSEWLAQRKAKYPTKARIAEKKKAEAAEQAKRAEVGGAKPKSKLDKAQEKAERLRQKLAKVERRMEKRKREANDNGDDMRIDSESDTSDSDDDEPEALPSKKQSQTMSSAPVSRADPTNHCKYYSTGGNCGKKGKCRFVHDPAAREEALREIAANNGRPTLKHRLLRAEKAHEEFSMIQTIVQLRADGRLMDPSRSSTTEVVSGASQAQGDDSATSSRPAPVPESRTQIKVEGGASDAPST